MTTEPEQDREPRIHALAEQIDEYLRAKQAPPIWWHLSDLAHEAAGCVWDDEAGDLGAYDCEFRPVPSAGRVGAPHVEPGPVETAEQSAAIVDANLRRMGSQGLEADPVVRDLRCPNCGASASLPLGMTCDDHRPEPVGREGIDTQPETEVLRARIASAMTWIDRYESKNGGLTVILSFIKDSLTGAWCVDATPGAAADETRFAVGEADHV